MAITRQARAIWNGDLLKGTGVVSASTSSAFSELPVTWGSRTESDDGRTSPEELLAAAHASCFCMALSAGLGRAGTAPTKLEVTVTVKFDKLDSGWKVVSSSIDVRGKVSGIDADGFQQATDAAKDGCPISQALTGNVNLSAKATLDN